MRQTVRLRHLPYADVVYGGSGAYKSLAVAASHPDVITGAGGAGLVGGAGDRDEVGVLERGCVNREVFAVKGAGGI